MLLPNGITGFYDIQMPPEVDRKQFKQLCFDFASWNRGKVIDDVTSIDQSNFYYAQIEIEGRLFYILLNKHYPYLAFASEIEFGNIKFTNNPVHDKPFSFFYQVLAMDELNVPFNQNQTRIMELNRTELQQIAYWKPKKVGEIIFNYWD
ncbi:hypothetical protein [Bacillus sp. PS06]|uniref:hypothetical protein n=1 Tax=Bacillus sp. PS06 TaxID=2764176 RepID=UPI001784458F|nr:hypothetical protein [Bacillus sp. PS06]MBD8071635.1 hypothetical protein [Bacillus sp. PS06]